MTHAIIMAQGGQRRLRGVIDCPKQLVRIGGEPLLARTLRLLGAVPVTVVCDTLHPDWAVFMRQWQACAEPFRLTDPGECILDGLWGVRELWRETHGQRSRERTAILLGDVLWSAAGLQRAMTAPGDLVFIGSQPRISASEGELFGMVFSSAMHRDLQRWLDTVPCRQDETPWRQAYQPGHLRNLAFHSVAGQQDMIGQPTVRPEHLVVIDDFTHDIDTAADIARIPEWEAAIAAEEAAR